METREANWQANFETLKAHVAETGHFPNKHTKLNNWCRYQRKRIKTGTMPQEEQELFGALAASRSDEHTSIQVGGRSVYTTRLNKILYCK